MRRLIIFLIVMVLLLSGCTRNSNVFERLTLYSGDERMDCIFGISSDVNEFELNNIQLKIFLANDKEYNFQLDYYAAIIVSNINGNKISLEDIENKQNCIIIKEYSDFFENTNKYELRHKEDDFNKFKFYETIKFEQTFFPNDNSLIYITFVYIISETKNGQTFIYENGRISYEINYNYKGGKLCIN